MISAGVSKNILLVDDSLFFRTKLSSILIEAGHRVSLANDGREAIKKIELNPDYIDLLILDLQMPHIDGFGVLEWMKKNGHSDRFPVLVITSIHEIGQVVGRLKSLGVSDPMRKDCPPEQVIHRTNRILFPKNDEARVEKRVPLSIPVHYTLRDKSHLGFMLNVSTTGLSLRTRTHLLPDSVLGLKFSLPDSSKVFDLKGVVKWFNPSNTTSHHGGAGIHFTSISDEDREELMSFIMMENK
jgi:uncharacterized protein (TIGR02266 family)